MAKQDSRSGRAWVAQCAALFIPFTALLHHALFYPHNCILNKFGEEYDLHSVQRLLLRNPAFPWAVVAVLLCYRMGLHARLGRYVQLWAVPFFIGFLPLSVWVWDIPFFGKPVCRHWHDGRLILPGIGPMRGLYLYAFGVVVTALLFGVRLHAARSGTLAPHPSQPQAL